MQEELEEPGLIDLVFCGSKAVKCKKNRQVTAEKQSGECCIKEVEDLVFDTRAIIKTKINKI